MLLILKKKRALTLHTCVVYIRFNPYSSISFNLPFLLPRLLVIYPFIKWLKKVNKNPRLLEVTGGEKRRSNNKRESNIGRSYLHHN